MQNEDDDEISGGFNWIGGFGSIGGSQDGVTRNGGSGDGIKPGI